MKSWFIKKTQFWISLADDQIGARLLRGSFLVGIFTVSAAPLGYILRMLLSRGLSVEMYGLFYATLAFIGIFTTYNDLGFGYSLTYLVPKFMRRNQFDKVWQAYLYDAAIELGTAIVIFAVIFGGSDWLSQNYFHIPEAKPLLIVFGVYFIGNCYVSALQKLFMGLRQEVIHLSIPPFILGFTVLGVGSISLLGKLSVTNVAWCWGFGYLAASVVYTLINLKQNRFLISQRVFWDSDLFKHMAHYALPTILNASIFTFITATDTFFLTLFRGVSEVGVYNVLVPIAAIPLVLFSPIESFLLPYISHFYEGEKEKITTLLWHTQTILVVATAYISVFVLLFPVGLVQTLFGKQWSEISGVPLQWWAAAFSIVVLSNHANTMISGVGKVRERLQASIGIAVFNVTLSALLVYYYGVLGAVWANIATTTVSLGVYLLILRQVIAVPIRFSILFKVMLLSLGLFFLIDSLGWQLQNWLQLVVLGSTYTCLFILGLFLVGILPVFPSQLKTNWLQWKKLIMVNSG